MTAEIIPFPTREELARRLELTQDAVMGLVDRFGHPGDYMEHFSTDDLVMYLTSQGFPEDIATAASHIWRGW